MRQSTEARGALAQPTFASIVIPPATPGYPLSNQYQVFVNGQPCPVYDARVFFELNNPNRVVSYAHFDFTGAAVVEIVVPCAIECVRIRPTVQGIVPHIEGRQVRFVLDAPAKLSVEINGGIDDNLHLFASRPEADVPAPDDPDVLYYGPGVHHIDGGYGFLQLKSNQTLYLAPGAVLRARLIAEGAEHIRVRGRGVLEGTTLLGRCASYYREYLGEPEALARPHFAVFRHCNDVEVSGIFMNDTPAWALVFDHCEDVRVRNIKQFGYVDNSDAIDVVSCRDVLIEDVFLRANDDCVVIKSSGEDVERVLVRDSVMWSDRAQALQIGHETQSNAIRNVVFRNIDVLEQRNRYIGHYAIGIFNGDTATVSDILFEDIRVENSNRLIGLIVEKGHFGKTSQRGRIENVRFVKIDSATTMDLHITGIDEDHGVRDISFEDLTVRGAPAEPEIFANLNVHNLIFRQGGREIRRIAALVDPQVVFEPLDIGEVCNRSRIDEVAGDGQGWLDLGPEMDMRCLVGGVQELGGLPFHIPDDPERGAIVLRSSQHLVVQPYASYPVPIGRTLSHLFFLQGTAFTDIYVDKVPPEVWIGDAGKLRFNQSPAGTPLWHYRVRYQDDGSEIAIPVKAGWNVEDWEIWAPGGWVVPLCGKKFYIQQWDNPFPDKPVDSVKVETALRPEVPIVLAITMGIR